MHYPSPAGCSRLPAGSINVGVVNNKMRLAEDTASGLSADSCSNKFTGSSMAEPVSTNVWPSCIVARALVSCRAKTSIDDGAGLGTNLESTDGELLKPRD